MSAPRFTHGLCVLLTFISLSFCAVHLSAQQNPKRLIMKDGTYQLVTKWEVTGDRVRYYSAERYAWEEIPKDLVDWTATDKYNAERGSVQDEAIKEIGKEDEADEREA